MGIFSRSDDNGGKWTNLLYYTPDANNPNGTAITVENENLENYFSKVDGTNEPIVEVNVYKNNLSWLPKLQASKIFGLWHEFTLVKSTNYFWSFEKDDYGICVQRGKDEDYVKNFYRGSKRTGVVDSEGRVPSSGHKGDTIQDVFKWIHRNNFIHRGYDLTDSACHYFASGLFEAVARQNNSKLK